MTITSASGERFWAEGLAAPMYYDSDTERLMVTKSGMYLLDDAAHEWIKVPFAPHLTSQTIGYVEKHGHRTETGVRPTTDEIHAAGYAVRVYNINNDVSSWRINSDGRVINLPTGDVDLHDYNGFDHKVALVSDVLKADRGRHAQTA